MSGAPYELDTGDPDVELIKYPADPLAGDPGPMYALRAHKMTVLIYLSTATGRPYVVVDPDGDNYDDPPRQFTLSAWGDESEIGPR